MVQMEGTLPLLTSLFHDLTIDVPLCIRTGDMPAAEITGFHYDSSSYAQSGILIRGLCGDHLLAQRLIGPWIWCPYGLRRCTGLLRLLYQ